MKTPQEAAKYANINEIYKYDIAGTDPIDILIPLTRLLKERHLYGKEFRKRPLSDNEMEVLKQGIDYLNEQIKRVIGL